MSISHPDTQPVASSLLLPLCLGDLDLPHPLWDSLQPGDRPGVAPGQDEPMSQWRAGVGTAIEGGADSAGPLGLLHPVCV